VLRERFGTVHVNVGEPIQLNGLLESHLPKWREQRFDDDTRLPAVNALVGELALSIMRGINAAAAVTPINLLATALLATPAVRLPDSALMRQLDLYQKLLRASPYSPRVHGHRRHAGRDRRIRRGAQDHLAGASQARRRGEDERRERAADRLLP
jgi:glycerol-3-phosphate O-acyltransferase